MWESFGGIKFIDEASGKEYSGESDGLSSIVCISGENFW